MDLPLSNLAICQDLLLDHFKMQISVYSARAGRLVWLRRGRWCSTSSCLSCSSFGPIDDAETPLGLLAHEEAERLIEMGVLIVRHWRSPAVHSVERELEHRVGLIQRPEARVLRVQRSDCDNQ